ncbi:MAG: hypothetical protein IH786_02785 [Proteobacteria bacterium]|nr:hypothetical protein [Pseudomonadota bacterium]
MHQSLIVIDDFYPDPEAVREAALGYAYPEGSGPRTFPGRNSRQKHLPQGMDQAVSQVIGARVAGDPNPETTHGKFRITLASDASRYLVHADPTLLDWVGVIYLNLPEQCRGGTAFFRHKGLGSDRTPMSQEELAAYGPASVGELLSQDGNDPDKWLHLMTVPMRFNRLILYRPWSWHSAGAAFGTSLEDGRLIQLVAFQTQPGAPGAA